MFGFFKKKRAKSHLAKQIKSKGLDQVTTEVVGGLMRQLSGTGYMYHFILAELDGGSMGSEKAREFVRESGIPESEFKGQHKFEHPLIDGPKGAKTILDMACLGMLDQPDLVVAFRLMTLDKLMRQVEVGRYDKDSKLGINGDRFWEWVKTNCDRVKFEPQEIKEWGEITELDLRTNDLIELPDDVLAHTGLVKLSLFQNEFSSVPESIFFLTQLNYLDVGLNKITTLPKNICKLKSLKILNLQLNQLTSLPSEIGELTHLEQLYAHNNCLTSIPKEIGKMEALKHISFYDNDLSTLPDEILDLKNLKTLELNNNNFTKEDVKNWTEKLRDTKCEISFGYQKNQIAELIRVVENIKGGPLEHSHFEMYLNSVDGEAVANVFRWHTSDPAEDDLVGRLLVNQKYRKVFINEGLNAIDSLGNITPINMDLSSEFPSDESELIEWAKIIYIQTCKKFGLRPNSKLRIIGVGTGGDETILRFAEH